MALEAQSPIHVTGVRKLLDDAGFTPSEVTTVFDYLRHNAVVTVDQNGNWSISGMRFNLR